jgi:hypothetical protein
MIPHIMLRSSLVLMLGLQVLSLQMCQSVAAVDDKSGQAISTDSKKVTVEPIKLVPVDEGPEDPSFAAFRRELLTALQTRDERFVLSIVDPNIKNGSDTERGLAELRKLWELDQPDSALWDELTTVLKMGGSFRLSKEEGKEFCAPYVTSEWPTVFDKLPQDAFLSYYVITEKDLAMRAEPNSNAPMVATLTYDVVKVDSALNEPTERSGFMRIITLNGQVGYVPDETVRSASEHHAVFKKVKGKWLMTVFAAIE